VYALIILLTMILGGIAVQYFNYLGILVFGIAIAIAASLVILFSLGKNS